MGSVSSSDSKSKQKSFQTSDQAVWGAQAPYLQSLYGQGERTAYGQMGTIGQDAQRMSGGLMQGAGWYLTPGTNPAIANLMQMGQQGNPYLTQQIEGLGADIGNFFKTQIQPGIASQAGLHGQFGGSRHGIGAGLAGQDALRQFTQGATNLRSSAYGQGIQSTNMAGQLASQGVGQMGEIYNLGMSPYSAQWAPLQAYSGILGDPTVLTQSRGGAKGWSQHHGGSFSMMGMGGGGSS